MATHKLSIKQRTHNNTGWSRSTQLQDNDIKDIKILNSRNDKSLNAIPSPLARVHLFDAAFSIVYQDELQKTNHAGTVYQKIVSDCFDVFELLFNWNSHKRAGESLKIINWSKEIEIELLKQEYINEKRVKEGQNADNSNLDLQKIPGFKEHLVGNTLSLFLDADPFNDFNEIQIILLGDRVIAGTSPLTGFFTTPNDLSDLNLINPLNNRKYFSKSKLFTDRDSRVRKFIYDFIVNEGDHIFKNDYAISKYLNHQLTKHGINIQLGLQLENLKSSNNSLFNQSIKLKSSKQKVALDYFEDYLVRINYRINENCFYTVSNLDPKREYDYLLPLSPVFYADFINKGNLFNANDIPSLVSIIEKGDTNVEVAIHEKGRKLFSKTYKLGKSNSVDGEIINLTVDRALNFSLSLFPNIIVNNRPELNNYFKIMLGLKSKQYNNEDINLSFYTNNQKIEETGRYIKSTRVDRTRLKDNFFGSTYFEINGKFDFIQLSLKSDYFESNEINCSIVPKWQTKDIGNKKFKCSIDFGTTTSFVGLRDKESSNSPFALSIEKEGELLISHFHKPKEIVTTNIQQSPYDYEEFETFNEFTTLEIKEFLPVIIGSSINSKYKFPLRTAICELNNTSSSLSTLSNANIAFSYEKIALTDKHQSFKTNLKWSVEKTTENRIRIFIEELAKIIKYKIILSDGNPFLTDIIWFYPLSFGDRNKELFQEIWKSIFNNDFKNNITLGNKIDDGGALIELTESEAPFYFHKEKAVLENFEEVLSIDIGGGSTDIVYFQDGNPKIGSSFNFATNLLWSDGNVRFGDSRENGIFNAFARKIRNHLNDKASNETDKSKKNEYAKIKLLNTEYLDNLDFGSDDIINFWLSNDEKTSFTHFLKRSDHRLTFLFFFSSIIYHSAQLLKSKGRDKPPSVICFSGNGSKVIDLITNDKEILSEICKYVINSAYEIVDNDYTPQVVLPVLDERKEATSFGGLYKKEHSGSPTKTTHLGILNSDIETFENVSHYKDITSPLEKSIYANIEKFIGIFYEMNNIINFKDKLGIDVPLGALGNIMFQNTEKNFKYEKDRKANTNKPDETINDSPFFWALKGLLFDLSILDQKEMDKYKSKLDLFFDRPTSNGGFLIDKALKSKSESSLYKVEIEDESSSRGKLFLLTDNDYSMKVALLNTEANLLPACNFDRLPNASTSSIKINSYGEVEKDNNAWVISKKIEIEFI